MATPIVVYSSAHCAPCRMVKEYLTRKGAPFTVKDVGEDPQALRELVETWHSQSTPTLVIDGKVVVGFHRERIDTLLEARDQMT
jgi:glutaredoxin 3